MKSEVTALIPNYRGWWRRSAKRKAKVNFGLDHSPPHRGWTRSPRPSTVSRYIASERTQQRCKWRWAVSQACTSLEQATWEFVKSLERKPIKGGDIVLFCITNPDRSWYWNDGYPAEIHPRNTNHPVGSKYYKYYDSLTKREAAIFIWQLMTPGEKGVVNA